MGKYHQDVDLYKKLMGEIYTKYPDGINLPPEYADHFQNNTLRILIRLARYKFVARLLKKTDTALEVGCGSGVGAIFLGQHCKSVKGIDANPTELAEARKINLRKNVTFEEQDFFAIPDGEKYNVVLCLDVIEHMPVEEGRKLVQAMARHLTHDGMLVVGSPSIHSYPYQGALSQASHIKCYDQDELVALIDEFCERTLPFSMNDEMMHTGHPKMAWYYMILGLVPRTGSKNPGKSR
ncbi:MAG: hypothetical protein A2Z83_07635 [Omnitrophica bacterium GWA2_52_8]|nr:MAG: hypothetical protein A2Z83_07635 [Omnitrophica bacterium GWA2_52_8]